MKNDNQIQNDVMAELKWDPFLNAAEIGVAVKKGVVTLSGQVDSYAKKLGAEKAAKRVSGVKAIAEDIQIGVSPFHKKTDAEIAQMVLDALKWHSEVQNENITIKVEDGIVTLQGKVEWNYQRLTAKSAVVNLAGVRSVIDLITVDNPIQGVDVQQKIRDAFQRSATVDASNVKVTVTGNKVTLKGTVRSFVEKADAEGAAWAAPGVMSVKNLLEVQIPQYAFDEI